MPRVRIKTGEKQVLLPDGGTYDGGDVVDLTDAQVEQLSSTALGDEVVLVSELNDVVGSTDLHVAHLPVAMASIADGDVVAFTPGFAGTVLAVRAIVDDPATTAAKTTTLNLEIGTTNLTGGVLTLTSANMTPEGAIVDATAVTGANTFDDDDVLTLEASATTAFVEGRAIIEVLLQES